MKRIHITPNSSWQDNLARTGFDYQSLSYDWQKSWQHGAYYQFNQTQIDELKHATNKLHQMYFIAAKHIIKTGDYARLGIDDHTATLIEQSFAPNTPTLYGRFDLCYDGQTPPKLYEYNADTPTLLFESGLAQKYWQQAHSFLSSGQFNSIHERLLIELNTLNSTQPFYLTTLSEHDEEYFTTRYLQAIATQAGLNTHFIELEDIGHCQNPSDERGVFVDLQDRPIHQLFKLYPWEWLIQEEFSQYLFKNDTTFVEPAYKLLFDNKALLAILWELFPNHPNLLATYLQPTTLAGKFIKKPYFSRQGQNVSWHIPEWVQSDNPNQQNNFVYQQAQTLPAFITQTGQTVYAQIGSWIIGHGASGIGIRESSTAIATDEAMFVPHLIQ